MASASAIEVRVGRGDPSAMALNPGKVLDPTSIGRSGMWRVDGPGVLDVHGYIYYDGKALYVQSADDKQPIMVNKHRVSTAWTEVQAGSTIEVGRAELFYRAQGAADADATVARPMTGMGGDDPDSTSPKRPSNPTIMAADAPKPGQAFRPGAGTFANRADDESTRLRPIGDDAPPTNQAPRPAAGAPMARPNIGRPMMEAQESTVIAPIEDLSGGRGAGGMGPRPGIGMGGPPMGGMGGQMMGGMPGQMQMGAPGMQGMPPGMRPGMPGMPGQMPGQMGMPGQMPGQMGMPGQPGQMGMPGQPWGVPGGNPAQATVSQQAVNLSPVDKFKADWQNFPPTKKAIMIGCPFIMIAALFLLFDDDSAPAAPTKPVASTSASASGGTAPTGQNAGMNAGMQGSTNGTGLQGGAGNTGANPAGFQGGNPFPGGTTATPDTNNTSPFGSSGATVAAGAKDAGAAKDPKDPKGQTAANAKDDADGGAVVGLPGGAGVPVKAKDRTNERMAADTWAEGNYELAGRMYDELARQHPENPAFSEAAAILRQKVDAGAQ